MNENANMLLVLHIIKKTGNSKTKTVQKSITYRKKMPKRNSMR